MNRTRVQQRFWLALALIHIVLVAVGATGAGLWKFGALGRVAYRYGVFSGSGSTYPFFAPEVGTSIRAEFDLFDSKGKPIGTDSLVKNANREVFLRIANIVEIIDEDLSNEETRRALATSWAGKIFARHPEASKLKLRVDTFDLPSMAEYRQGKRYDWENIYSATIARNSGLKHVAKN